MKFKVFLLIVDLKHNPRKNIPESKRPVIVNQDIFTHNLISKFNIYKLVQSAQTEHKKKMPRCFHQPGWPCSVHSPGGMLYFLYC